MEYRTISTSACGRRKQVVRITKDGKKSRSKTYHIHYECNKHWLYQKLPGIKDGDLYIVPPIYERLPSFNAKRGEDRRNAPKTVHTT